MIIQEKIKKEAEGYGKLATAFLEGAKFALENQWINVDENLPCDNPNNIHFGFTNKVLVKDEYKNIFIAYMKKDRNNKWIWCGDDNFDLSHITHWMPIPKVSKELEMTREKAKEWLPIIKAFAEGKAIQFRTKNRPWFDLLNNRLIICEPFEYRIKPEPKYRPFKNQEECWDEMHKHPDFGWVKFCNSICFIQNISFNKITVISDEEICSTSFEGGFTNMKFVDGTPFGVKMEELL